MTAPCRDARSWTWWHWLARGDDEATLDLWHGDKKRWHYHGRPHEAAAAGWKYLRPARLDEPKRWGMQQNG
jgi:hypothetical protein